MNYFNYFTEIEETFVRRRGKNLMLSPLDWALIESWQRREIPLHIVLRGIEKVFDLMDAQPVRGRRTIKSIAYCKEEVETQFAVWLDSQTGKAHGSNGGNGDGVPAAAAATAAAADGGQRDENFSRDNIAAHLARVIAALRQAENPRLGEDFTRAARRLEELKANLTDNLEHTEANLTDIENFLDRALLANADSAHLKNLEREIAVPLSRYKAKMDAAVYEQTCRSMLLKRLRDEAQIPRLSLFYL